VPMWVVNLDTLKFLDVNRATIEHYGYTNEEFLSMTIKDIRPPEDVPRLEKEIHENRQDPQVVRTRLTEHRKKNGELIKVEIQFAEFQYKGIKANIVIANDITQRLNYIKAIEDQNEKLREISWIQSHIVRAPLTRIMGLIPLINDANENNDEKKKMLEYILTSANELDDVIKHITDKTRAADFQDR